MATYNKAAMQYQRNAIQTASPAKLTLMLYDGAIKFANMAIEAIDKGDIEKANNNIIKVQNIIVEFRSTLDMKYPGWQRILRSSMIIFTVAWLRPMSKKTKQC